MIKICHLTSVHQRYDGRIFRKECQSLFKAGFDVSLIVADGKGDEVADNIKIFDTGFIQGRVSRIIKSASNVRKKALELDCDVYHFHDPELIFAGLKLKRKGKKVIFDMHENVPVDIEEKEYIHPLLRKIISYVYRKLEVYAVKKFDGIVSTRESINERLEKYNQNIELVTNFPLIETVITKKEISSSTANICFAGAVVPNWQHEQVIRAIEGVTDVHYHLAGPADEPYLDKLKKLNGWSKVKFEGKIPFNQVKSMYETATIGVAIYVYCKNMDDKRGNLANTKLFEYMNWEIPIICTDFTLWKQIIEDEVNCGICVAPYDLEGIRKAINYLKDNPDVAKQMGKNGRKAVLEKYNWDTQAKKIISLYRKITHYQD